MDLEDHLTVFVDFLGFKEASRDFERPETQGLLALLRDISGLQGNFSTSVHPIENGHNVDLRPSISSFSDHVVISYPLDKVNDSHGMEVGFILILHQVLDILLHISSRALDLGFLIRGGAAIGKLFHRDMVVFGPALVEAYNIEATVAGYPRVVLSEEIVRRNPSINSGNADYLICEDGLWAINFYRRMVMRSAEPGDDYREKMHAWYDRAIATVTKNLASLKARGRLKDYAKWAWFAEHLKSETAKIPEVTREAFGVSLDKITW